METKELMNVRQKAVNSFLVQQELRKRLSASGAGEEIYEPSPEDASRREECAKRVRPFDKDIEAGQIRMLSGTERPTYALVARRWDENSWLVIPFSDYSNPATETELKLRLNGGIGLRVAQLWNARSLLTATLAKSWLVATFSDEDVADVVSAWEWSVGVGELSEDQLMRTGLPIMRRDDPRIAYEDEALANFAELDAADLAANEHQSWMVSVREAMGKMARSPFCPSPAFEADYALAASDAEPSVSAECTVPGFEGIVNVRYDSGTRKLHLRVFGADGGHSTELDGWSVFGSGEEPLGAVKDTAFAHVFHGHFDGVLALVDEEGNVFPLTEAK